MKKSFKLNSFLEHFLEIYKKNIKFFILRY